jgi:hypothetical protein
MRLSHWSSRSLPLAARTAVLFTLCALGGWVLAPQSDRERQRTDAASTQLRTATLPAGEVGGCNAGAGSCNGSDSETSTYQLRLKEEVQQLLAEGGCPGWIALAGEPDIPTAGSRPASMIDDPAVEPTAGSDAPPRVQYPKPLAVESSGHAPSAAQPVLRLAQLPPVGDELINEQEDLLHSSPEISGAAAPAPTEAPPAPAQGAPVSSTPTAPATPSAPPVSSAPAVSPTPAVAAPAAQPKSSPRPQPSTVVSPEEDLLNGMDDLLAPPPGTSGPTPSPSAPSTRERRPRGSSYDLLNDRDDLLTPQTSPQVAPPTGLSTPLQSPATGIGPTTTPSPFVPPPSGMPPMHGAPGPRGGPASGTPPTGHANTAPSAGSAVAKNEDKRPPGEQSRCTFEAESLYPSAKTCRVCHEKIYEEWSVSSHAYAAVSPMFQRFEQKINDFTQGTIGYFCYRCHTPVGTTLGISRAAPMYDLPPVAREGVTCIACHRIREWYGKTNGERRIEPGDVYAPMYGPFGGDGVAQVVDEKAKFKVKTSSDETGPGQPMHSAAFSFPQLSEASFCTSCHQVAVYPGIKLEVVWEQYRASPACKKGISCQDCHMGRIPGVASGYEYGAAAEINKQTVNSDRKHANHVFYGPGYSIAHPGVFPFNPKADRWSMKDWLQFDWRAGWGTDAFEDAVDDGAIVMQFPEVWKEADDRYDAREIIEENLKKKQVKNQLRRQVMENGSHVDGPFFTKPRLRGRDLEFNYIVTNTNEGHNLPTASLGAQPQLWANVALINPRGERVWESGYLDRFGDLADIHSEDVRHKRIAYDWQLFNLQTMFLITGAKGTDREFFLPVNIDIDPLPFIRPAAQPITVLNHPPFIRMEARSLAPLGARTVPYKVPGELLREPGRYRLSFRMRNRTEPMYFMRFCDSTAEMQRAMMEGTLDFHQSSVEFDVE